MRAVTSVVLVLGASGCALGDGAAEVGGPTAKYQPEFLPVELSVSPAGVSITGSRSIVTPIGTFSIDAKYSLPHRDKGSIDVVLRDQRSSSDRIYRIQGAGDHFTAVVNGRTKIDVSDGRVLIDVTDGSVRSVKFAREKPTAGHAASATHNLVTRVVDRWNLGYRQSWYKPFAFSRWAYDDSTINRWYGVGFVWFLARLAAALVLCVPDILCTAVFVVAQLGFIFLGATVRNIIYGTAALVALISVGSLVGVLR